MKTGIGRAQWIVILCAISTHTFAGDNIGDSIGDNIDGAIEAFETGLRPAVSVSGETEVRWTLEERMEYWNVPGLSIAVIRNGKLAWAKAYGVKQQGTRDKVDTNTVFSVGSVSKVGAAAVTLRLVDAGELNLDQNVNDYLGRWHVPDNAHTAIRPVTMRGILSHSAGLTVHGFPDFQPGETLPTVIDTLEGRPPAKTKPVRVDYVPGSRWRYSGGGVTVEQLVIEEITGLAFNEAATKHVFDPLGMARSTYQNPIPAGHGNIAKAHDREGQPRALPRGWEAMPEQAASGLWTTPSDYARLVVALIGSYNGDERSFLGPNTARAMMSEMSASPFGLGPQVAGRGMTRHFHHGGSNDSYKAWMEGHLSTRNGVVVFTNGANGLSLISEVRRAVAAAEGWGLHFAHQIRVPKFELSAAELEQFAGDYDLKPSANPSRFKLVLPEGTLRVWQQDGVLRLGLADRGAGRALIPEGASHFVLEDWFAGVTRVEFTRDYAGRVGTLILHSGDHAAESTRVAEK